MLMVVVRREPFQVTLSASWEEDMQMPHCRQIRELRLGHPYQMEEEGFRASRLSSVFVCFILCGNYSREVKILYLIKVTGCSSVLE